MTSASAICCSVAHLSFPNRSCSSGARLGAASLALGAAGAGDGRSGVIGVTFLSLAAEVSGAAFVVVSISCADASLPSLTWPLTWPLTWSAPPDSANLSASSRFFGAWAATAWFTARMNAALSKPFGLAAAIFSACAALPCASLSSGGATAASRASFDSFEAGGCCLTRSFLALVSAMTPRNRGSACGAAEVGAAGGAGQLPA